VDGEAGFISSANLTRAGLWENREVDVRLEEDVVTDMLRVVSVYG
jgi:phosphatidylserine/phosphatidylglycerophosphate/cardiolipin synthase-like enzyme